MNLSEYHGKRIAVVIDGGGVEPVVIRGTGHYERDPEFGNCLRIALPHEQGSPHLVFYESAGEHRFQPDNDFGCDWSIRLGGDSQAAENE